MATFFSVLRREYPEYAAIATHVKNEGKRTQQQIEKDRALGLIKGCADILIPGNPSFVCEMKSQSPSAKVSPEQINYLIAAQNNGAFSCICLGYAAALEAFNDWICKKY